MSRYRKRHFRIGPARVPNGAVLKQRSLADNNLLAQFGHANEGVVHFAKRVLYALFVGSQEFAFLCLGNLNASPDTTAIEDGSGDLRREVPGLGSPLENKSCNCTLCNPKAAVMEIVGK